MKGPHVTLELPDADVAFDPLLFGKADADRLFAALRDTTPWRQEGIRLYAREVPLPRLTAWHGDAGAAYRYSGIPNAPVPWTDALLEIRAAAERAAGAAFNGVLLNRYRTGLDGVAWHSDDEPEFGDEPVIASVSFGATRRFQLRHKARKELRAEIDLTHGSLLVMRGATQRCWVHQVPKTKKAVGERINLTFRLVRA